MKDTRTKMGASKLNYNDIDEIQIMFEEGLSDTQIAKIKNVSRPHINLIRNGKRWNEENWTQIPKSNDYREFYTPVGIIPHQRQDNPLDRELEGLNDISTHFRTDKFQFNYYLSKMIEALTGKKPTRIHIEF